MAALLLAAVFLSVRSAYAAQEEPDEAMAAVQDDRSYEHLAVGTATPLSGNFFSRMWGNTVTDLDVRTLLHGYNLVEWVSEEGIFRIDPSVVSGIVVTENREGDRTYVMTICQDLLYSDGSPITARDYAFTMLLSMAPEVEELGASLKNMEYIRGYRQYREGTASCLSGIRILGDYILSVTIESEYLPFFFELALLDCTPSPISVIAPGCQVSDDGKGVCITNIDRTIEDPLFTKELLRKTILDEEEGYLSHPSVSSGPYRLLSYDGEMAEFEINEYYKGNSAGVTPSIRYLTYRSASNEELVDLLEKGDLNLLSKCVPASTIHRGITLTVGNRSHLQDFFMTSYTRSGCSFFSFCCEQEPVNSNKVRQAIALCLNKDALVRECVSGYGLRVDGYYGIGQWMYQLVNGVISFPAEPPQDEDDKEARRKYEKELKAWQELSMDGIQVYRLDVAKAVSLLEEEGFIWNRRGEPFDKDADDVRCRKNEDGSLTPLDLRLIVPEGSVITDHLETAFLQYLEKAGISLEVESRSMEEVLSLYYRQEERDCQLIFLASNFDVVFDPSESFQPEPGQDPFNATAIRDSQLYDLAVDMRHTEPGDVLGYCKKWVAFQERFASVLPMIPVYSNIYYDFYSRKLHNYNISSNITWGQAIISAWLSDAGEPEKEDPAVVHPEGSDGVVLADRLKS